MQQRRGQAPPASRLLPGRPLNLARRDWLCMASTAAAAPRRSCMDEGGHVTPCPPPSPTSRPPSPGPRAWDREPPLFPDPATPSRRPSAPGHVACPWGSSCTVALHLSACHPPPAPSPPPPAPLAPPVPFELSLLGFARAPSPLHAPAATLRQLPPIPRVGRSGTLGGLQVVWPPAAVRTIVPSRVAAVEGPAYNCVPCGVCPALGCYAESCTTRGL